MMHGKNENTLIIIENGRITSYALDDRNVWEIGRPSKDNTPDIRLHSATVSRRHGKFQNIDGIWFYIDYNGKNGTVYNHMHIETGLKGRRKPIVLNDGDTFVFGGGEEETINSRTVWGMYMAQVYDDVWRVIDSKDYTRLRVISDRKEMTINNVSKGTVLKYDEGIVIYMGNLTYTSGDIEVTSY